MSLPPSVLTPAQLNTWRAQSVGYGNDEQQYCYNFRISLEQVCQTTLTNSEKLELLEQIFGILGTKNVSLLRFSQQIEAQRYLTDKVLYVEGSCRCPFALRVEATARAFQED